MQYDWNKSFAVNFIYADQVPKYSSEVFILGYIPLLMRGLHNIRQLGQWMFMSLHLGYRLNHRGLWGGHLGMFDDIWGFSGWFSEGFVYRCRSVIHPCGVTRLQQLLLPSVGAGT